MLLAGSQGPAPTKIKVNMRVEATRAVAHIKAAVSTREVAGILWRAENQAVGGTRMVEESIIDGRKWVLL